MFLAPSRSNLGESLLITTLLGIPLGEPDGKTMTAGAHRGASRQRSTEEFDGILRIQLPARSMPEPPSYSARGSASPTDQEVSLAI